MPYYPSSDESSSDDDKRSLRAVRRATAVGQLAPCSACHCRPRTVPSSAFGVESELERGGLLDYVRRDYNYNASVEGKAHVVNPRYWMAIPLPNQTWAVVPRRPGAMNLAQMIYHDSARADYVRFGDTYVPAWLDAGNRYALATTVPPQRL